MKADN